MAASPHKQNDAVDKIFSLQAEHKDTLDFTTNMPLRLFQAGTQATELKQVEKKFDMTGSNFLLIALLGFYWKNHFDSKRKQKTFGDLLIKFVDLFPDADLASILSYRGSDDNNFRNVRKAWLRQTKLFPQNVRIATNAASFLMDFCPDDALVLYEHAEQMDPKNPNWLARITLVCLNLAYSEGRFDHLESTLKSIQSWNKFLSRITTEDINPNDIELNQILIEEKTLELAELALSNRLLKEAFDLISRLDERALQIEGNLAQISTRDKPHSLLGRIYLAEGKFVEAKEQLKIMGDFPNESSPHPYYELVLANTLLNCGFSAAVSDYLQQCVRADSAWLENAKADPRHDSSSKEVKNRCQKMTAWLKSLKQDGTATLNFGHSHYNCCCDDTA